MIFDKNTFAFCHIDGFDCESVEITKLLLLQLFIKLVQ